MITDSYEDRCWKPSEIAIHEEAIEGRWNDAIEDDLDRSWRSAVVLGGSVLRWLKRDRHKNGLARGKARLPHCHQIVVIMASAPDRSASDLGQITQGPSTAATT